MNSFGAWLYITLTILGFVLLICWIVLPFALIGTKPLLSRILKEQQRTNDLLEQLAGRKSSGLDHAYATREALRDIPRDATPRFRGAENLPPV